MANPYTTTVTFPVETLGTGDTWQLILTFSTALDGTNAAEASTDHGLEIIDHGTVDWGYDNANMYLSQGSTEIVLADTELYFAETFLFGSDSSHALAAATDKQFIVEIKLNGTTEFYGNCVEDSLRYNYKDNTLKFTASPKYDLLKNTMMYDEDGATKNPIGYDDLSYWSPFSTILEDIYKLVSPSVVVTVRHDWDLITYPGAISYAFSELKMRYQDLYNNADKKLNDLSALLKHLALSFFARTGMINNNKAIFERIGYYDSSDTQSINIVNYEKEFRYPKVTWVQFVPAESGTSTLEYEMPDSSAYTNMEGRYINESVIPYCYCPLINTSAGTLRVTGDHVVGKIEDPFLGLVYYESTEMQARSWYGFRNSLHSQIVHKFKCSGVSYQIDKTVLNNGVYYQIISLSKDWEKEVSTMECFRVS